LHQHLNNEEPYLEPVNCEIIEKDGAIIARFNYKAKDTERTGTPLLDLANQLDPEKKLSSWDSSNKARHTTVAIVLCVVNRNSLDVNQLRAIEVQLALSSERIAAIGRINIEKFQMISLYDKRTLSPKHTSLYAVVEADKICRLTCK
jgi:hypothetical protein